MLLQKERALLAARESFLIDAISKLQSPTTKPVAEAQPGKCCHHLATAIIKLKEQLALTQDRAEAGLESLQKIFQDKMAYLKDHEN